MKPAESGSKRKAGISQYLPLHASQRAHKTGERMSDSTSVEDQTVPFVGQSGYEPQSSLKDSEASLAMATLSAPILLKKGASDDVPSEEFKSSTSAEKAWSAFKTILPILEKVSVVFPPLQSAIGGVIQMVATFDVSTVQKDFRAKLSCFDRHTKETWRRSKNS